MASAANDLTIRHAAATMNVGVIRGAASAQIGVALPIQLDTRALLRAELILAPAALEAILARRPARAEDLAIVVLGDASAIRVGGVARPVADTAILDPFLPMALLTKLLGC